MPRALRVACSYPGCGVLVERGRCGKHATDYQLPHSRLYKTTRWRRASAAFLAEHPYCQCGACRYVPATVVDHIIPHRNDPRLFWDESNWQALTASCHSRKTAGEVHERRRRLRALES